MPKRICPFQYDLLPQRKIHLSEKEVFTTIESQKQVHDKTMAMLFNGARRPPYCGQPAAQQQSSSSCDRKRFTQLRLDSECRLAVDGRAIELPPPARVVVGCGCHVAGETTPSVSCGSCDGRVCLDCIAACQRCGADVCKACAQAMFVYTDRYVCRDCTL